MPPSVRWHWGRLLTLLIRRHAFARFGERSVIVAPLRLRGTSRISIGSEAAIYEGCWLEAEPSSLMVLGDRAYLGHGVHVHAVDDVTIGNGVMIVDHAIISAGGHQMDAAKSATRSGPIHIGDDVFIGQNAVVVGGVTIGDRAIVGAGAVVTRDVPAGATVAGVPARVIRSSE
ncbi:DapH/DapD/GlmU-related protein [Microbacterium sp. SD291]|uniref:acyltransferase n=1 Tax=Microbacterium sp. SD291 TaxID=2782007 RepID=UPI001ED064FD|nr:DapH/DapD/GlmU-related protein [Microbacterium sp. SD291]MBO0981011.1 acyltransferase [Microbacterium sp. SD291]